MRFGTRSVLRYRPREAPAHLFHRTARAVDRRLPSWLARVLYEDDADGNLSEYLDDEDPDHLLHKITSETQQISNLPSCSRVSPLPSGGLLPLKPISSSNSVRPEVLRRFASKWAAEPNILTDALDFLTDSSAHDRISPDASTLHSHPPRSSKISMADARNLCEWGVLAPAPRHTVRQRRIGFAFKVPKADAKTSRLVVDDPDNPYCKNPPHFHILSRTIRSWAFQAFAFPERENYRSRSYEVNTLS